jgi:hypothetical protein
LKIIEDKRGQTNAKTRTNSKVWLFALKFPSIDKEENLNWLFKQGGEWDKCREAQKNNSAKVPKTAKEKSQGVDWQEICNAMLEKHKRLTTNELLFADDEMKFDLEAIHVPLALVERNKPKKCSEDISPEQGSRLYEPSYEEKQRFQHEAFLEQVIRDGVGKTQGHRIAALVELIGNPQLDDDTRRLAVSSLGEIYPGNQKAIDALVELINKTQLDDDTRRRAASSLGKIGSRTKKQLMLWWS